MKEEPNEAAYWVMFYLLGVTLALLGVPWKPYMWAYFGGLAALLLLRAGWLVFMKAAPPGQKLAVYDGNGCKSAKSRGPMFVLPVLRAAFPVEAREESLELPLVRCRTSDDQSVSIGMFIAWQTDETGQAQGVKDPDALLRHLATRTLRQTIRGLEAHQVLAQNDDVNKALLTAINGLVSDRGIKVTRAELTEAMVEEPTLQSVPEPTPHRVTVEPIAVNVTHPAQSSASAEPGPAGRARGDADQGQTQQTAGSGPSTPGRQNEDGFITWIGIWLKDGKPNGVVTTPAHFGARTESPDDGGQDSAAYQPVEEGSQPAAASADKPAPEPTTPENKEPPVKNARAEGDDPLI